MEFKFKIQSYQTEAVDAVVNVFNGQPYNNGLTYKRDSGKNVSFIEEDYIGYGNNPIVLNDTDLFNNIKGIQKGNNIPISESLTKELGGCELDVEMETGTGKTYVYIKTMFELNKKYGWSKFIIVVPSIAIREGVKKTFEMTVNHFMECYGKKARFFVYNSENLNQVESFSSSADLHVMIINVQAFNTFKEGANNNAARIIYSERDDFGSRRPIDVIKANNPILIIDEPQKMKGQKSQAALKNFNPLFSIYYSATHKEKHNPVYVLDALDAYNKRLVKKIEVKGFEVKNIPGTDGYIFLHEIRLSKNAPPMAKLEFEKLQKSGVKRIVKGFIEGESIYSESGDMEQYKNGYYISNIDPFNNRVTLGNGAVLCVGEAVGDVSEDDIRRIQIRETIASHFDKEEELFNKGIKTLSLFFIDEVAKYRQYDDNGEPSLGEYGKVFEEEYEDELNRRRNTLFQDDPYQKYLREMCSNKHNAHNGYFSIDKKSKHFIDGDIESRTGESSDVSAYDLILKNKERLLSFDEPTRFIFSHSALREGWDNPNIFQICTLKHSNNAIAQRQEVGRGLRICVDKDGNRMDKELLGSEVFGINTLTVIASDSYASFVDSLQKEIKENLSERPRKADLDYFNGKTIMVDGNTIVIDSSKAKQIYRYLLKNDYLNDDDTVSESFKISEASDTLEPFPKDLKPMQEGIIKLVKSILDPNMLKELFKDARCSKILDNPLNDNFNKKEFQELWKAISPKYVYKVEFESDELIKKSISYINENLKVKNLQYVIRKGSQKDNLTEADLETNDSFKIVSSDNRSVAHKAVTTTYDLVGRIAKNTSLTRRTVVSILKGLQSDIFDMFKINPEDFIIQVSKYINYQKATMVVQHITYREAEDIPPYKADIFTADKIERDFIKAYEGKKSIQKYMFLDGKTEENFAKELDIQDNEVYIYAKLPRGFQIPTPMGNYAPDWAIVFNQKKVKHVFFVAETKGSLDTEELRGIEDCKISCAKKLFSSIRSRNIHYEHVSNYQDLMNKVL